ncbi:3-hydroxyacyl-ACP dehydratase FabZ [Thermodesulfovibrionales bacterium]|nr:3-hydroxyacyl-ACP dehydratase FabZ [Thermodesulfovibrionales bacterium]MCL0042313.1 3-hydroxyacyl-ACP dehydratase FabZ [Thermodesulfovibrionales bacterium]MCL0068624.1 3-hydroxyacyl-ACP dehydratase FabZ [Thermodesulfovibrionales bacterium]MCL0096090.1 3-hydroxyacyl-ACP dehydratase FabZ [Thermodesulfovibrionales bacterium]
MVDTKEILSLLPHRYPFLLVDRVIELEPNNRVVGIKNVTINEPFFQGHFPDNPIMPGVLIVEAMAQAAGILAFKSSRTEGKKTVYFMSIEKVKFRRPVLPGDQLRLEIQITQTRGNVWKFSGNTFVGDRLTTEAEFIVMIADEEL